MVTCRRNCTGYFRKKVYHNRFSCSVAWVRSFCARSVNSALRFFSIIITKKIIATIPDRINKKVKISCLPRWRGRWHAPTRFAVRRPHPMRVTDEVENAAAAIRCARSRSDSINKDDLNRDRLLFLYSCFLPSCNLRTRTRRNTDGRNLQSCWRRRSCSRRWRLSFPARWCPCPPPA